MKAGDHVLSILVVVAFLVIMGALALALDGEGDRRGWVVTCDGSTAIYESAESADLAVVPDSERCS